MPAVDKPKSVRIDVVKSPRAVVIRCYPEGWKDGQILSDYREEPADYDVDAFLARLRDRGWSVRTWGNGARAWLGEPWPIRSTNEIIRLRNRLDDEAWRNQGIHPVYGDARSLDLAFDL